MLKIEQLNFFNYKIKNFEINKPGLFGLIGRNGSGKSTFFSILNGETITENSVIVSSDIMYISNMQSFDKNLNGFDYFKLLSKTEYDKAIRLSKYFDSYSFLEKKIGKYSLGMLEQFSIIISLAVESEIVIFDEIHGGLDLKRQKLFYKLLDEEKANKIIVLTSHHLEDVFKYCDKVFMLNENIEEVNDFSYAEHEIGGNDL